MESKLFRQLFILMLSGTGRIWPPLSPVHCSEVHIRSNCSTHGEKFEILAVVVMRLEVFWDASPCCLTEIYRRFRGTCCGHYWGTSPCWKCPKVSEKLVPLVIVVVEAADCPETTPHPIPKYTASRPRVQQSSLSVMSLLSHLSVSFLLLPFPIRGSSFCVCSILLPAMDQWRKLLSFSCFIPTPRQKKKNLPSPYLLILSKPARFY